ncbi:MAG: MerR family transcriptional regulator [bacterium]
MRDGAESLRIGELAARSGKTIRALHLYEQMGLLPAAERSECGYRLFRSDAPVRIEWIDALQSLGLSLAEIREFDLEFERRTLGPQAAALARKRFKEKLVETRQAIERLRMLESELCAALEYLEACRGCIPPQPSAVCPECDVPREKSEKPILMKGFYSKPGPPATRSAAAKSSTAGFRIAQRRRRARKGAS